MQTVSSEVNHDVSPDCLRKNEPLGSGAARHWADSPLQVVETRSLAGCDAALAESPDVAGRGRSDGCQSGSMQLNFSCETGRRFPRALGRGTARGGCLASAERLMQEAGAIDVIGSVLDVPRVARLACRHVCRWLRRQNWTFMSWSPQRMPWPAHATACSLMAPLDYSFLTVYEPDMTAASPTVDDLQKAVADFKDPETGLSAAGQKQIRDLAVCGNDRLADAGAFDALGAAVARNEAAAGRFRSRPAAGPDRREDRSGDSRAAAAESSGRSA